MIFLKSRFLKFIQRYFRFFSSNQYILIIISIYNKEKCKLSTYILIIPCDNVKTTSAQEKYFLLGLKKLRGILITITYIL